MRDIILRNTIKAYDKTYKYSNGGTITQHWSKSTMKESRARGNLVQGDFKSATYYRAYRMSTSDLPFRLVDVPDSVSVDSILFVGKFWLTEPHFYTAGLTSQYKPALPQFHINEAADKLRAAVGNQQMQLAESLVEIRKTLRMITSTTESVLGAYRAARKGQWGRAARLLGIARGQSKPRSFANGWLAMQYGWKPLLSDIFTGANAIVGGLQSDPVATSKVVVVKSYDVPDSTNYRSAVSYDQGIELSASFRIDSAAARTILALGISDPLSIGWELLPYSFVVDWFIPIGNLLQAMSSPLYATYIGGYRTNFNRLSGSVTRRASTFGAHVSGVEPVTVVQAFAMERFPEWAFPLPGVYIRTDLNLTSAISLIALLTQRA